MADVQKPVEVAPSTEPVAETKVEETPAATTEAAPVTETPAPAHEATAAAEDAPAVATAEEPAAKKEEEVKPVEEGHLEHKGSNFPKNFLYSKKFFWFGSDPVDTKAVSTFKHDKVVEVAHHVTAWAAETGKGLLFFSERADKSAPHGAIQLAEATEPAAEGTNKFHFTSKGHKHTFKAASTAERDNWVSQLKLKIAEAKDLAKTVPESETYKKTIESFKPKKEDKAVVAAPVAAEPAAETTATEEPAKVTEPAVPAVEEPKKEEVKKEEPKRRSASRKRASIFGGSLFGKKEEAKKEDEAVAETKATETEAPAAEPAATVATEAPAAETTAVVATEPAPEVTPAEAVVPVAQSKAEEPKVEEPKTEEAKTEAKAAEPKPKRGSIFGTLSFGKKSKATSPERTPAPAAEETPATTEAVAETAPVIPAVETTEPLSAEVSSPATVPTETVEAGATATNGEVAASKKEVRNEKRKSSLPFGLGAKKEKATSDEETEKPKSPSPFSKLRQTIKGNKTKSDKPADKAAEKPAEDKAVETEPTTAEPAKEGETAVKPAETEAAPAAPVVEEAAPVEKPVAITPAVQAAA